MSLKPSVERVRQTFRSTGLTVKVTEFLESTRTAAEAIGTTAGQIAKSLVFMVGDEPVLVLASGVNRVDVEKMNRLLGKKIINPDAETVKNVTGFSIGGVSPVAHSKRLRTLADEDLLNFSLVYAAAGSPNAVFAVSPGDLIRITKAEVINIKGG